VYVLDVEQSFWQLCWWKAEERCGDRGRVFGSDVTPPGAPDRLQWLIDWLVDWLIWSSHEKTTPRMIISDRSKGLSFSFMIGLIHALFLPVFLLSRSLSFPSARWKHRPLLLLLPYLVPRDCISIRDFKITIFRPCSVFVWTATVLVYSYPCSLFPHLFTTQPHSMLNWIKYFYILLYFCNIRVCLLAFSLPSNVLCLKRIGLVSTRLAPPCLTLI